MANLNEDLRKLLMAGVGAISTATEKVPEAIETLAKRGEETLQHGKVLNEQLRHEIKQAVKENVTVVNADLDKDGMIDALQNLSQEDLKEISAKIAQLQSKPAASDEPSK